MTTAIVYVLASVGEIAGCFSFWAWQMMSLTLE
jgi:drug/metabolite transporter superfamily protein YnfA